MRYRLRTATVDDYSFIEALNRATMKEYVDQTWGWNDEFQARYFREHFAADRFMIVVVAGEDAGVVAVIRDAHEIFLSEIQIMPRFQRQGLGTAILESLIHEAEERKVPVRLQVLKVNPARRLYERHGFVANGETDTHYLMYRRGSPE